MLCNFFSCQMLWQAKYQRIFNLFLLCITEIVIVMWNEMNKEIIKTAHFLAQLQMIKISVISIIFHLFNWDYACMHWCLSIFQKLRKNNNISSLTETVENKMIKMVWLFSRWAVNFFSVQWKRFVSLSKQATKDILYFKMPITLFN